MIYDIYNDTDGFLSSKLKEHSNYVPFLEKTASHSTSELLSKEELTEEAFADKQNKMFPIYTKEAAALSALYIVEQHDKVSSFVKEAAQEALNMFGIDMDINKEIAFLKGFKKTAGHIALSSNDFIFPEHQKLPVLDEETFTMSKEAFFKQANELSPTDIVIGARQFIKKASELNVSLDDNEINALNKMAIIGSIDTNKLEKIAQERYIETGDTEYKQIAQHAQNSLVKVAENGGAALFVSFLQKEAELKTTDNIVNSFFEIVKTASAEKNIKLGNEIFTLKELKEIDQSDLIQYLPKEDINLLYNNKDTIDVDVLKHYYDSLNEQEKDIFINVLKSLKG